MAMLSPLERIRKTWGAKRRGRKWKKQKTGLERKSLVDIRKNSETKNKRRGEGERKTSLENYPWLVSEMLGRGAKTCFREQGPWEFLI